jgi:hypothetical protein
VISPFPSYASLKNNQQQHSFNENEGPGPLSVGTIVSAMSILYYNDLSSSRLTNKVTTIKRKMSKKEKHNCMSVRATDMQLFSHFLSNHQTIFINFYFGLWPRGSSDHSSENILLPLPKLSANPLIGSPSIHLYACYTAHCFVCMVSVNSLITTPSYRQNTLKWRGSRYRKLHLRLFPNVCNSYQMWTFFPDKKILCRI